MFSITICHLGHLAIPRSDLSGERQRGLKRSEADKWVFILPSSGAAALERFATGPGRYVMKSTLYQISSYHNPVISIYGLLKNCVIQKRERGRERDRVKARERERAKERERTSKKKFSSKSALEHAATARSSGIQGCQRDKLNIVALYYGAHVFSLNVLQVYT
jgi:hypothetical protein